MFVRAVLEIRRHYRDTTFKGRASIDFLVFVFISQKLEFLFVVETQCYLF